MTTAFLYAQRRNLNQTRRQTSLETVVRTGLGFTSLLAFCLVGLLVVKRPTAGLALGLAVGLVAVVTAVPARRWVVLVLIPVAILPGSTYGAENAGPTLFSRGSGILGLPAFDAALMVLAFTAWALSREPGPKRQRTVLGGCVFLVVALYLVRAVTEPLVGTSLQESFKGDGGRLLLVLGAAYLLTVSTIRKLSDVEMIVRAMAWLGVLLAGFGITRFFLLGGDPSNPYRLYSAVGVKLTFFEGSYGVFLAVSVIWALVATMATKGLGSHKWPWVIGGLAALVTLLLTYRRTNWIALIGAGAVVAIVSSRKRSATLLLLGAILLAVASLSSDRNLEPRLSNSGEIVRWSEMGLAANAVRQHPLGQGTQGRYEGTPGRGWPAPPTVVHNSFLWLGLKLGLPGMALLIGAFVIAAGSSIRAARNDLRYRKAGAVLASLGAFWLVNLSFGTPLLETRYAILFGVWLGLVSRYSSLLTSDKNTVSCETCDGLNGALPVASLGGVPSNG